MDSNNWTGYLGVVSKRKKIMPKKELVPIPTISELQKLPILTSAPAIHTYGVMWSHNLRKLRPLLLQKINSTIITPKIAPWPLSPEKGLNFIPSSVIFIGKKISKKLACNKCGE